MPFKKFSILFPLSITEYGILYILLGLVLFGGFSWLTVHEVTILQAETRARNLSLAKEELKETVEKIIKDNEKLAKNFADWEETIQQFSNGTYYSYWREYRVPSASFVPNYLNGVELYNKNGVALASPGDKKMPEKIHLPISRIKLIKQRDKGYLFYTYPISYGYKNKTADGYVMTKIDFFKALAEKQRFKYADIKTITINSQDNIVNSQADIIKRLHVGVIPNLEFNQLQHLMYNTLRRFAAVGISLALLLLYLLIHLFGLPSRRLSRHIDALRRGDQKLLQNSDKYPLAVAEFEKIRRSLNDYQSQLDNRDAALRENEMRMRAVLDNVVDGIITIDEQGVIESHNPAITRIFELGDYDVSGKNLTTLLSTTSLQNYYSYYDQRFQGLPDGKLAGETCELMGKRLDNTEFPIEIALSRMHVSGLQLLIVVVRDITERKRSEERLVYLANYDELTGLPNRTLFRDRLKQAVAHAKREQRLVGVIFFDLDHFKKINDTLGHHAGDQLLLGAAKRLKETVRELDTVARLGGDEFMVILESIKHVDEVTDIVTKMLLTLEKPFMLGTQEAFVAASAGIAIYPFDDNDIDNLVKNADTAMFRAKEQGGNTYQYFKAEMNVKAVERLKMESALRYALERDEFQLHYQPRMDLNTGVVLGMEALLRWNNPQLGVISPVQFIPLLEETGLIVPVGDWVLKTACEQTRRWHDAGYPLIVSVNLSVRQFRQKDLVARFRSILDTTGFNPEYLELEITESLLIDNVDAAITILGEFHEEGVKISIDDFGTGYSSLSYLKRFPINTLKIDRSFVRDIIDDPDDAVITAAIVAMARSLRMNVIAEGVETSEQLNYLKTLQCDEAQGFYFSKPIPASEFENFLGRQNSTASSHTASLITTHTNG